ncbi:MAG: hypothetical protein RL264_2413 [Bacteroidota bacterium]|jgi:hypothetical protein
MDVIEQTENPKRPTFLLVLTILTFVNTGFTIIGGIAAAFSGGPTDAEIKANRLELAKSIDQMKQMKSEFGIKLISQIQNMTDSMYANFMAYNLVAVAVAMVGALAAFFMFQGRKIGFHIYIIYSFLYILQSYLFIAPQDIPMLFTFFYALVSGAFIWMYSRNLFWMN